MNKITIDTLTFCCCFCNKTVEQNQTDPCSIDVLINIDKEKSKQHSQNFWCHLSCFKDTLDDNMKQYLALSLEDMKKIEQSKFICCFCNTYINSNKTDPCDINILINWNKEKNKQCNQIFYCHLHCFKKKLSDQIKSYLALYILLGEADDEEEITEQFTPIKTFDPNDKRKLYWLINQYLLNHIDTQMFCNEFVEYYNELDIDLLTKLEYKAFAILNPIAGSFSKFKDDFTYPAGTFYNVDDLKKKVIETKELLSTL